MAASNNNNSLDHTELLNIAGLINSGIKAKIKPDPDPALVNASDLSGIQDAIVNYLLKQTTPPPPTGITWVTQPGAPIINATSVTETASSLNNNGTTVNVSGQTLTVPFAPTEGKRTDAIVINYSAVPAVYERIEGSTDHYLSPSAFPVVPTDRLFVRYLSVTDGQIQQPTTGYTDEQAIDAAKTNIGTGSGQFAEGNHDHSGTYAPANHNHDGSYVPLTRTVAGKALTGDVALVKGDVGLGNVDNTSDTTKNSATATLTNKTISGASNTLTNIPQSAVTNLDTDLGNKVTANAPITGTTATKVTYDSKGLVTAGAAATTADINDSTNRRYVTDAQQTVIGNTSGTNTGNETATTLGTTANAAAAKTTLVDADNVLTTDSAASHVLKKWTFANVKANLKSYFDTLYQAVLVSGTNIKTINGSSVLGSGNLTISGGGAAGTPANNNYVTATPAAVLTTTEQTIGTITITPTSATAKIMVVATQEYTKDGSTTIRIATARVRRGTTNSDTQVGADSVVRSLNVATTPFGPAVIAAVDTPNTTNEVTYTIRAATDGGSPTVSRFTIQVFELAMKGEKGDPGAGSTDASTLTTGTLADARLSSNVPLKDALANFTAGVQENGVNLSDKYSGKYLGYLEVTGDYTITAADHNRILIYNSVNPATFTINDITQVGLEVVVHQINTGMVTFVKSVSGNHAFNVAGGGANATTRGLGGTVVLSSYFTNKYSWLYTYRGGADSGGGGAATTGTTERSWQVGQGTDGTTSTFEAAGTATDINAIIKPKGAGYAKLEGVNYTLANNKVLILDTAGNVKAEYEISEEQVAVPADLNSPGVPGTWAREAGFVYFCYGAGWEKMAAVGAALEYLEVYVAIPVSPTSTGTKGQRAYDSTNSFMYECIATNTWIRYTITKTW